VLPKKSDPEFRDGVLPISAPAPHAVDNAAQFDAGVVAAEKQGEAGAVASSNTQPSPSPNALALRRRALLAAQNASLSACDRRFRLATRQYVAMEKLMTDQPQAAQAEGESLVSECVSELLENGDSVIRLLSEGVGEPGALHPVNVMVLSLLLGKALGMKSEELHDLGVAALLHDIGKAGMPLNIAFASASMTLAERAKYETHVATSVALATRMGWGKAVLAAIAQHHEMVDGSGFPLRRGAAELGRASQVVALVNHYDRMCSPQGGAGLTPHETLSVIFAQHKARFDSVVLGAFIRMMGVYPPGSIVQLVNDRYAIVASVNSSRPLRPRVIVHDSRIPKDEAPILDLETVPELGIRRSLKPSQLPREALDYLSPRKRICYFFERAVSPDSEETEAPSS
jgi:HD-GYP domain-containing protein (c-di-GMP phosphodiesterase class II)